MAETILPNHLGFIVDGNRRWARERGLTTFQGHKKGFEVLKQMAYAAKDRHLPFVSAFVFSTENWGRSKDEVDYLMRIFIHAFKHDLKQMVRDGFKIIFLGRRDRVSKEILDEIATTEEISKDNNAITLALCFNYGGWAEITDAAKHLAADAISGKVNLADVNETNFSQYLYHPELPPVDMMVRTSGERRLSGFQLWRVAYSELMFIDKKWPDMTEQDLDDILAEFAHRQRRFGK